MPADISSITAGTVPVERIGI